MKLLINRQILTELTTIGKLYIDGVFECFTLEPRSRGLSSCMSLADIAAIKVPGRTAQPTGTYQMDWYFSPDHGIYLPRVLNVPGYDDDEIHKGNFYTDTKGCTLLGTDKGTDEVLNSKVAVEAFYPKFEAGIKAGPVSITYQYAA